MTKKEEHYIEAKAYENTDFHYFKQIVGSKWVCTPTSPLDNFDERNFTEYDVLMDNGRWDVYIELKGREIPLTEKYLEEGCIINKRKIDNLEKKEHAYVVMFFFNENRTFVWDVHKRVEQEWKLVEKTTSVEKGSDKKWTNVVYLMPFDKAKEIDLDLSGYMDYFNAEKIRLTNIYENVTREKSI